MGASIKTHMEHYRALLSNTGKHCTQKGAIESYDGSLSPARKYDYSNVTSSIVEDVVNNLIIEGNINNIT